MRGEYKRKSCGKCSTCELPPRARRIPDRDHGFDQMFGTTSACAENTPRRRPVTHHMGNYLRVRGEYSSISISLCAPRELPPRARRILLKTGDTGLGIGTTSACAENTRRPVYDWLSVWNYLRVRGEYYPTATRLYGAWELPPRARRIHTEAGKSHNRVGTTSACAENTYIGSIIYLTMRNYLRVRGEYTSVTT